VEERLGFIHDLARKHRVNPDELTALQQKLIDELEGMQQQDLDAERLTEELEAFREHYRQLAAELSAVRHTAAIRLGEEVTHQIQQLGMPGGQVKVQLQPNDPQAFMPHGQESVELLISANPGQPPKPLTKVASGGELSRISLGIQVTTAQTSRVPTLVFDEVDVGIGGPTAEIVGSMLRKLGSSGQVLTVTHLPQVAAHGHQHLFVRKEQTNESTSTRIDHLSQEGRVQEIARMLGGVDMTEESLAHARKLMSVAH
jgi:DNA repair protein RecN (Recombination protein N)